MPKPAVNVFDGISDDPEEIVFLGLQQAIATMEAMPVNEGQITVLTDTILPRFEARANSIRPPAGWIDISCNPYCDFMSEITETGNQIMRAAYEEAREAWIAQIIERLL